MASPPARPDSSGATSRRSSPAVALEPEEVAALSIAQDAFEGVFLLDKQRRIRFWNPAAERLTGYTAEEVMGRCCSKNILTHLDQQGRKLCRGSCPASRTIYDGKPREIDLYLHHKDGYRVPVATRVLPHLDAQGKVIGAVQLFTPLALELDATGRLGGNPEELDPETGVAGGLMLEQRLEARLNELRRFGWPLGVVLVSLQHALDQIAPIHGDQVCQRAVRMVARSLANGLRSFDLVGRRGVGAELVCLVTNVQGAELAVVAQKLRRLVLESSLELEQGDLCVTPRMAASLALPDDDHFTLIERLESAVAGGGEVESDCPLI